MKSAANHPVTGNFPRATPVVAALLLGLSAPLGHAIDNFWTGAVSSDWNDGANWSEAGVPDTLFGDNAVVATTTPNIATIAADISATPNDIIVNSGGRIDQLAGVAGTFGGAWMFVGQDSTPSVYNLADTSTPGAGITGYAQGTGTLNPSGNLQVGSWGADRNGTININTTEGVNVAGGLFIGNDNNCVGVMNLETGAVTVSHGPGFATDNTQVGHNGGNGTLNISGGSLSASRNFRVGNEGGTGSINITGGSLLIGGTDDIFIGRDRGTGVVTQSGGIVDFNHNTFIGNGNNASSSTSGTYSLNAGVLNVKREFAIGREGANATHTGTLNVTGGTLTKTGDEKFLVGHNNGKGFVVQSGGTITANNELYIGNENSGAEGTYTLSDAGALTVSNEVVVGRESGTGILNVNGGTITTVDYGNMYIGRRNGTGTLNQSNGVIIVNKEFGVGTRDDNKIGTGTYNLSGGSLSAANNIFIGKEQGSSGTLNMTGGTMSTSDKLQIGHNQSTGLVIQSGGTVNVQNEVYIGNENNASSVGTYTLSGTGALSVGNEVQIGRDNGTGTLNLNGGTITAKKLEGGTGSATVNFNGGVLKAKENQENLIQNLDTANVQSGGLKIDSNGFNVGTSQALTGTGGLEKLGAGNLTLNAASTYTGATTVSAGQLVVGGSIASSQVTVNNGGALAGSGSVGGLIVNSGGTVSPGNSPGNLAVAGNLVWNGGGNYNWQVLGTTDTPGDVAGTTWDLITVTGTLDLSAFSVGNEYNINLWSLSSTGPDTNGNIADFNPTTSYEWLAVSASNITGFNAAHFAVNVGANNGTGGFRNALDGGYTFGVRQDGGNLYVTYGSAAPIPEPGTWAAMAIFAGGAAYAGWHRRRRAKVD